VYQNFGERGDSDLVARRRIETQQKKSNSFTFAHPLMLSGGELDMERFKKL
jgi:hypothetical protein